MVPAPLDVKTTSGEEADVGSGLRAQLVKVLDVVAQADGAAERAGAGKWLICEVFRGYLLVQGCLPVGWGREASVAFFSPDQTPRPDELWRVVGPTPGGRHGGGFGWPRSSCSWRITASIAAA